MPSTHHDPLFGLDLPAARQAPRAGRFVAWSLTALALVVGLAGGLVTLLVAERAASLDAAQRARMEATAQARAEVLAAWLESIADAGRRLTGSELVRLFASEMALARPGTPLAGALAEQLPYFQQLIADFAGQHALVGAALLAPDGRGLLSSGGTIGDGPRSAAARAAAGRDAVFQPVRMPESGEAAPGAALVLDLVLPVPLAQVLGDGAEPVAAWLVMTVPVAQRLAELLDAGPRAALGERFRLIQAGRNGPQQVVPGAAARLDGLDPSYAPFPGQEFAYGPLPAAGGAESLAAGAAVAGAPWTVLHEIDAAMASAPLRRFTLTAVLLAGLVTVLLVLAFVACWWRRDSRHHRELASQYRDLAGRIRARQRLLESITNAMREMLCLKTPDGRYAYVNPAFARMLARPTEQIVGRTDAELFGDDPAAGIAGDPAALAGAAIRIEGVALCLGGRRRELSISRTELCAEDGRVIGAIAVARDDTELVEQRRKRELLLRQTVAALVRAIELRDPFLLGHSRRLQHYALAVGRRLRLSGPELATIELAAGLSQVGKIFVADAILARPERHSPAETELMRRHVGDALAVVAPIDFELPVAAAIGQMHERLDGSGYPEGLSADRIGLPARILGAVDVFCARTAPRSYRDQISPGRALYHLASNPGRYDVSVVSALAAVVAAEKRALGPDWQVSGRARDRGPAASGAAPRVDAAA